MLNNRPARFDDPIPIKTVIACGMIRCYSSMKMHDSGHPVCVVMRNRMFSVPCYDSPLRSISVMDGLPTFSSTPLVWHLGRSNAASC